jgi:hypothetical protein
MFPAMHVARLDRDMTRRRGSFEHILMEFAVGFAHWSCMATLLKVRVLDRYRYVPLFYQSVYDAKGVGRFII